MGGFWGGGFGGGLGGGGISSTQCLLADGSPMRLNVPNYHRRDFLAVLGMAHNQLAQQAFCCMWCNIACCTCMVQLNS